MIPYSRALYAVLIAFALVEAVRLVVGTNDNLAAYQRAAGN